MKKYRFICFWLAVTGLGACSVSNSTPDVYIPQIDSGEVRALSEKVLQWQLQAHTKEEWDNDWFNAALYHGVTQGAKTFDDPMYWKAAENWAKYHDWKIGSRKFHADDQASATAYLNIYEHNGNSDTYMFTDFKQAVDSMAMHYNEEEVLWDWCDALYMAPVPIAKLGSITEDKRYFELINKHFWVTYENLYDKNYNLFYRDRRFLDQRDEMGNPIFWSRGNGWVIAGLVGILQYFPEDNLRYHSYYFLYKSMMDEIIKHQGDDGLWRSNLLSPSIYPNPETSGTSFFAYGLAWGIRNEILVDEKFGKALEMAWKGLNNHINKDGKLGAAQSANKEPDVVNPENSELFATGAFLLASSELYKLIEDYNGGNVR